MAAAGSRIGNEFLLIQGLGYGKGLFCRQVIMGVAVFLQGCQVVEKRWLPEDPLAFQSCDCRLRTGADVAEYRFRCCLVLEFLLMDELPVRLSLCQRDMQFSLKRVHIMASVGVCTRPMELLAELVAIANARLAFMPTSQSAFARQSAAAWRLS